VRSAERREPRVSGRRVGKSAVRVRALR
jgi:hypothetical protein